MEADIRKLTRRHDSDDEEEERQRKAKKSKGPSALEQELAKYSKGKKGGKGKKKDEGDTLAALDAFRGKLKDRLEEDDPDGDVPMADGAAEDGEENLDVDDDQGWLGHRLHFPKDDGSETVRAEMDYEVIDPRVRGQKAKDEEREKKRSAKAPVGKAFQRGGDRDRRR